VWEGVLQCEVNTFSKSAVIWLRRPHFQWCPLIADTNVQ